MKNLTNLLIKTVMVILVLAILIPIFGKSTWTQTIVTGLVLVALSYVAGDLWILPKYGNFLAVVADFGVAALVVWAMERALPHFTLSASGIFVIALVLAVGEWLFHIYLLSTRTPQKRLEK